MTVADRSSGLAATFSLIVDSDGGALAVLADLIADSGRGGGGAGGGGAAAGGGGARAEASGFAETSGLAETSTHAGVAAVGA